MKPKICFILIEDETINNNGIKVLKIIFFPIFLKNGLKIRFRNAASYYNEYAANGSGAGNSNFMSGSKNIENLGDIRFDIL